MRTCVVSCVLTRGLLAEDCVWRVRPYDHRALHCPREFAHRRQSSGERVWGRKRENKGIRSGLRERKTAQHKTHTQNYQDRVTRTQNARQHNYQERVTRTQNGSTQDSHTKLSGTRYENAKRPPTQLSGAGYENAKRLNTKLSGTGHETGRKNTRWWNREKAQSLQRTATNGKKQTAMESGKKKLWRGVWKGWCKVNGDKLRRIDGEIREPVDRSAWEGIALQRTLVQISGD